MRYALIENGVVTTVILAADNYQPAQGITAVASHTAGIGDAYANGVFTRPVVEKTPEQIKRDAQIEAVNALAKSDITLLRFFEKGEAAPVEWKTYRENLREVVVDGGALPTKPEYT